MATTIPTPSELAQVAQDELRNAADREGLNVLNLRPGSRLDAFVGVVTGIGSRLARTAADRVAASLPSTSRGDDLDTLARDVYGTGRKEAARAFGYVWLARPSGGAGTIPKGSRVAAPPAPGQEGVVFEAVEEVPVASGVLTVRVPVRCTEAGSKGNLLDRTRVTQVVDTLPPTTPASVWSLTAPPGGTPAEQQVFGGGHEREDDDTLSARLLQLSPEDVRETGSYGAILAAALNTSGVRYAVAVEPLDGTVALYVGDENYIFTEAMRLAVEAALLTARGYGVPVRLRPFTVVDVPVTATIYLGRAVVNYDTADLRTRGVEEVLRYFRLRPAPDEYYRDAITAALHRVHPEVQHVTLTAPVGDVARAPDTAHGGFTSVTRYRATEAATVLTFTGPTTA